MQRHRIEVVVSAALFLACVVFNLLFSPIGEVVDENRVWLPNLLMGSIVVQPMLIALLVSLSSSFITLLPCAVSACVILGYAACVTSLRVLTPANATDDLIACGLDSVTAFLLGFAAASLVFLLIRRYSSLRIESHLTKLPFGGSEGSAARGRSIHAWASAVAVIVAIACIAHLAREWSIAGARGPLAQQLLAGNVNAMAAQVVTALLVMCLVYTPVVPVVWSALAFPHGSFRLLVVALGVWAVLGLICFAAFGSDEAAGAMGIVVGATAAGLLTALALRRCGYHMRLGAHLAC
jgi:MFS family permease